MAEDQRVFQAELFWREVADAIRRYGNLHLVGNSVDAAQAVKDWFPHHGHWPEGFVASDVAIHSGGALVTVTAPPPPDYPPLLPPTRVPGDHGTCNECGNKLPLPCPGFLCDNCRRASRG